jgi:hypothetical protein
VFVIEIAQRLAVIASYAKTIKNTFLTKPILELPNKPPSSDIFNPPSSNNFYCPLF